MATKTNDIPVFQTDEDFYANWMEYMRDNKKLVLAQNPKENKVKASAYGKKIVDSIFEFAAKMLAETGEAKAILRLEDMIEITVERRSGTGASAGNFAISVEALSELKKSVKNDTEVEFSEGFKEGK